MALGGPTAQPVRTAALTAFAVRPSRIYLKLVAAAVLALLASAVLLLGAGHWLACVVAAGAAAAAFVQGRAAQARWPARLLLDRRRGTLTIRARRSGHAPVRAVRIDAVWIAGGVCVLLVTGTFPWQRQSFLFMADSMSSPEWRRFVLSAVRLRQQLRQMR